MKRINRYIKCPACEAEVRLPMTWVMGVEVVFRCPSCHRPFKTGFKMGALLFAVSLAMALASANIIAFLFSSAIIPIAVLAVLPLWILYGFIIRKAYLKRKIRRQQKRLRRNQ